MDKILFCAGFTLYDLLLAFIQLDLGYDESVLFWLFIGYCITLLVIPSVTLQITKYEHIKTFEHFISILFTQNFQCFEISFCVLFVPS